MLDISFIRDNRSEVEKSAKARGVDVDLDKLLSLDEQRRGLISQIDPLRSERNELASSMGQGAPSAEQIEKGKQLKMQVAELEGQLGSIEDELNRIVVNVPNVLHESVPIGAEDNFDVVETVGEKPEFDFEVKDHMSLGESLGLIDVKTAADTSGSRFYYLKGDAVLLEFAVINWILDKLTNRGFTPVTVPHLVREKQMVDTGFFPADKNEIYTVNPDDDNLFLIGTSEVPLTALGKNIDLSDGETKFFVGHSTCYRREAGSYGKDTHGILRVHQFDKLEMFAFTTPDKSWEVHDQLLEIEKEILSELGFHYQVINIASEDLGSPAAKKYDCEVWIPSQGKFRELTSCSNVTDFQARRAGLKYSDSEGNKQFMHTLNGTAMAWTRTLIAILENNQTAEGRIIIPEVLRKYMGGKEQI